MYILKGIFKVFGSILLMPCSFFVAFATVYYCFRFFTQNVFDSVLFNTVGYAAAIILTYQFLKLFVFLYEKIKDDIKDFREGAKLSKYLTASLLIVAITSLAVFPPVFLFNDIFNPKQSDKGVVMVAHISYEMTYDGHLGDNWIKENSITGIESKTNDRFLCHVGDVVTIVTTIAEDDIYENHHDVGTQTSTHIITKEDLSDGFNISQYVKVEEKPSGDQYSRWKVVYTFKPNK